MGLFFRRFIGVLALDASIFEEIEADPRTAMHAAIVVAAAAAGARVAAIELGIADSQSFLAGVIIAVGGLLVWVSAIAALGTFALAEPQTHSSMTELLRTIGFAAAPGVFLSLSALRPAAPVIVVIVLGWMLATTVIAVRQSLDYVATGRAIAVCLIGALLSAGVVATLIALFGRTVGS